VDWSALVMDFEPIVALVGTVLAAIIASLFALQSNIQAKAWEQLFLQKKKEIEAGRAHLRLVWMFEKSPMDSRDRGLSPVRWSSSVPLGRRRESFHSWPS
jgi:hypothetical protein